jgi:threonine/homoserine/homoserine lactone efflux protein
VLIKLLESLLIGASIAASPGPIFFVLVRRTLAKGFRQGILVALGEFSGNFLLLFTIFFGASQYFNNHTAKTVFYVIGSLILAWNSSKAFRLSTSDVNVGYHDNTSKTERSSYLTGLVIAVTNPDMYALWISLSNSYLKSLPSHVLAFTNILFITVGFLVFFIPLAYIVSKTRHRISADKLVLLSKIAGVLLLAYSIRMLYLAITLR